LGDHVYFETLYDDNGNPMEGFETGRPLYSTIDRYIFDLLWKGYKPERVRRYWWKGYW
jgi:allantoicase